CLIESSIFTLTCPLSPGRATQQQLWLPFSLLHLVTAMSSTEGMEKHRQAGMGTHTAWSVATGPMGMLLWPPQPRWKQRSQSSAALPRDSELWRSWIRPQLLQPQNSATAAWWQEADPAEACQL
ncbi:LOW QUALITY PROTEIN: hypothetical protein CapIbe_015822, partial [Capra ibex]